MFPEVTDWHGFEKGIGATSVIRQPESRDTISDTKKLFSAETLSMIAGATPARARACTTGVEVGLRVGDPGFSSHITPASHRVIHDAARHTDAD